MRKVIAGFSLKFPSPLDMGLSRLRLVVTAALLLATLVGVCLLGREEKEVESLTVCGLRGFASETSTRCFWQLVPYVHLQCTLPYSTMWSALLRMCVFWS